MENYAKLVFFCILLYSLYETTILIITLIKVYKKDRRTFEEKIPWWQLKKFGGWK